jgi:hypothetical protein
MRHYEKYKKDFERKLEKQGLFKLVGEYLGYDGGKMLFECLTCGYKFETTYEIVLKKNKCITCFREEHSLSKTHPELAKNLLYKKDGSLYGRYSSKKLWWKCPKCGTKVKRSPESFNDNFVCRICSDGISYPNKFFATFLREANIDYEPEKVFSWSKFEGKSCFRYDFYIESKNMIVEVMGSQHYPRENKFFNQDYKTIHSLDIEKEKLAILNNIGKYVKIDCRISNHLFMKKSITEEMQTFFDLSDINWETIIANSLKSKVIEICEYYNSHTDVTIARLKRYFNTSYKVISESLKLGNKIGLNSYGKNKHHMIQISGEYKGLKKDLEKDMDLIVKYYNEHSQTTINAISVELNMNYRKVIFCLLKGNKYGLCVFPEYKHLENKILQFTEYGEFMNSFDTLKMASESCNASLQAVYYACSGDTLLCKNYIFRNNKR